MLSTLTPLNHYNILTEVFFNLEDLLSLAFSLASCKASVHKGEIHCMCTCVGLCVPTQESINTILIQGRRFCSFSHINYSDFVLHVDTGCF